MPYKRRKSNVNNSRATEKESYITGYFKYARLAQLRALRKDFPIEKTGMLGEALENVCEGPSKNSYANHEKLNRLVSKYISFGDKRINYIYDVLPPSY
jgi:hypothetical protein